MTLEQMLAMRQNMRGQQPQQPEQGTLDALLSQQAQREQMQQQPQQPGMRQPYEAFDASQPQIPTPGADHIGSQPHQALLSGLRNYGKPRDY